MVQGGTGVCVGVLALLSAAVAELPNCRPHNRQIHPDSPSPTGPFLRKAGISLPQSGNLRQIIARIIAKYTPDFPFPTGPFLRRQESILYRAASPPKLPPKAAVACGKEIPALRRNDLVEDGSVSAYYGIVVRPWLRDSCLRRNGPVGNAKLSPALSPNSPPISILPLGPFLRKAGISKGESPSRQICPRFPVPHWTIPA